MPIASLVLLLAAAQQAGPATPPDDDIVVTATKQDMTGFQTDAAVSVLTGDEAEHWGMVTTQDVQRAFPGLLVSPRGNRAYANFTIRGLSSPDYFNPSVMVYVDGVPQTASAFDQRLLDVDRIEMLRGPQGTLYGANALGGVLAVVTRKRDTTGGHVQATGGDLDEGVQAGGTAVLKPGALFFDLAGLSSWTLGRIDDASTGRRDIDSVSEIGGRARLRYAPAGGAVDAALTLSRDRLRSHEELYLLPGDVDDLVYRSGVYGPRPYLRRDMMGVSGTVNARIGAVTVSSISAWQRTDLRRDFPVGQPGFSFAWPQDEDLWSQELRAALRGSRVEGVAGLWFQRDDFRGDKNGVPGYYGDATDHVVSTSYAAFAEGTVHLTDRLDATLGGRLTHDRATIAATRADTYRTGYGFEFSGRDSWNAFQPKASIGYRIADRLRGYATVARGYKPGGFNHSVSSPVDATPYDPERGTNWEAGLKADGIAGHTIDLSLAAYRIDVRDQQFYVGPLGQQSIRNAAQARSEGIEAEGSWHGAAGTTLTGNVAFGRSRFRDFTDPATGMSYTGNTLPYAPDAIVRGTVGQRLTRRDAPVSASVWGGVAYASRTFFDAANVATQAPVATFDLGADLTLPSGITARLLARNVGDRVIRTSGFMAGPLQLSNVDVGRHVSLTLRKDF